MTLGALGSQGLSIKLSGFPVAHEHLCWQDNYGFLCALLGFSDCHRDFDCLNFVVLTFESNSIKNIYQVFFFPIEAWDRGGGGGTWVNVCSVCAAGFSKPLPHYSLFLANYRPHLSRFLENVIFAIPT